MRSRPLILLLLWALIRTGPGTAQRLALPERPVDAPGGTRVVDAIRTLPREAREERLYVEITSGNLPEFLRDLVPVTVAAGGRTLVYHVTPDYLGVGSADDWFLSPMTPLLAQRLADRLGCILPTRRMVDQIYAAATCRLAPAPIPPSPEMTTVPVFALHDSIVTTQRAAHPAPAGALVGGTKKDVIISSRIYQNLRPSVPRPVVIYGWHRLDGTPIQPLYNGHGETYVDYSHGIRLVRDTVLLDGTPVTLRSILADPGLASLVSDEGVIAIPRYPVPATGVELQAGEPESRLLPGYPNPFNPVTTLAIRLHAQSRVRLRIVGLTGSTVSVLAEGVLGPGLYRYAWDAAGMPSGVYFCRMEGMSNDGRRLDQTARLMLLH